MLTSAQQSHSLDWQPRPFFGSLLRYRATLKLPANPQPASDAGRTAQLKNELDDIRSRPI